MIRRLVSILFVGSILFFACKKEEDPYSVENTTPPSPTTPPAEGNYASDSFIGLHNNIFSTTCANSGCHDGNFPPDFRTIEASYNTLLYQPIVKNNPEGTYQYRVIPGDAENSILYRRLIEDIDGKSGIMPLVADPAETDWNEKKQQYINDIKSWINNGAPDIFGNTPNGIDARPGFNGVVAYNTSTGEKLPRVTVQGNMVIPFGIDSVDFYFSFSDKETSPNDFTVNELRMFNSNTDFENSQFESFNLAKGFDLKDLGFKEDSVIFTHKASLDVSVLPNLTQFFFQCKVKDARSDTTSIPSSTSASYVFDYFSFSKDN